MNKLVIAEKPSVGKAIAAVLGADGREGELVFRAVYALSSCTKPMKQLWLSSMEDAAIQAGFKDLRPGREYICLMSPANLNKGKQTP